MSNRRHGEDQDLIGYQPEPTTHKMASPSQTSTADVSLATPVPTETPVQLSISLPACPQTKLHIHLTPQPNTTLLFLTTATPETPQPPPLGSFVYAIPSRTGKDILTTLIYIHEESVEFTTRVAKALCRRLGRPVYVASSVSISGAGAGGSVSEELESWKRVVDAVLGVCCGEEDMR